MKMKNKISFIIFFTMLVIMLLTNVSKAYFTDYKTGIGREYISYGIPSAIIEERSENNIKYCKAVNTGDYECFIRIKIFGIGLQENMIITDGNWEKKSDGYIYYKNPIEPGQSTTEISINYNGVKLICIGEYCTVTYDENGNPYADWDYTINI